MAEAPVSVGGVKFTVAEVIAGVMDDMSGLPGGRLICATIALSGKDEPWPATATNLPLA